MWKKIRYPYIISEHFEWLTELYAIFELVQYGKIVAGIRNFWKLDKTEAFRNKVKAFGLIYLLFEFLLLYTFLVDIAKEILQHGGRYEGENSSILSGEAA